MEIIFIHYHMKLAKKNSHIFMLTSLWMYFIHRIWSQITEGRDVKREFYLMFTYRYFEQTIHYWGTEYRYLAACFVCVNNHFNGIFARIWKFVFNGTETNSKREREMEKECKIERWEKIQKWKYSICHWHEYNMKT